MTQRYRDRRDAGEQLAKRLTQYIDAPKTIVLALPRGGVPVAYEIARALHLPLDVYIVRKLGVPWHEELAMGALAPQHITFLNQKLIKNLNIEKSVLDKVIAAEQKELIRRDTVYRSGKEAILIKNQVVILVDDGIATGATMKAAIASLRMQKPKKIICAVPVACPESVQDLKSEVDKIICPLQPKNLDAVGLWYKEFEQVTDEEVITLLSTHQYKL